MGINYIIFYLPSITYLPNNLLFIYVGELQNLRKNFIANGIAMSIRLLCLQLCNVTHDLLVTL